MHVYITNLYPYTLHSKAHTAQVNPALTQGVRASTSERAIGTPGGGGEAKGGVPGFRHREEGNVLRMIRL